MLNCHLCSVPGCNMVCGTAATEAITSISRATEERKVRRQTVSSSTARTSSGQTTPRERSSSIKIRTRFLVSTRRLHLSAPYTDVLGDEYMEEEDASSLYDSGDIESQDSGLGGLGAPEMDIKENMFDSLKK